MSAPCPAGLVRILLALPAGSGALVVAADGAVESNPRALQLLGEAALAPGGTGLASLRRLLAQVAAGPAAPVDAEWYVDDRRLLVRVHAAGSDDERTWVVELPDAGTVRERREAWVLQEAQRLARAGSWSWDPTTDRQEVSPQFCALFGCTPEEMAGPLGKGRRFVTDESYARIAAARWRAVETGEPYEIEVDAIHADGRRLRLLSRAEALRDATGRVVLLVGMTIDVTALHVAREALAAQAGLLARMSALARVGGWEYDVATGALSWTEETWRIHGLEPGPAPPLAGAIHYYPGEAAARIEALFRGALERGEPYDERLPFVDARGQRRWVRTSGTAEFRDGRCVRVFGAIQDVTDVVAAEESLREAGRELERRNQELSAFATIAAHDLKEPARKVESFLGIALAAADDDPARWRGPVSRARSAATRMLDLVSDLLHLARAGSRPVDLALVDLGRAVDEVLADLEAEVRESGATIRRGALGSVEGDPRLLRQLLQNLLSNALKYRHPARPLELDIGAGAFDAPANAGGAPERWLRLRVADNGIGFDPRFADQLGKPFKRLHPRSAYEGTGIGLALVQRIVERHGGRFHAEGRPGEGAAFTIELPLRQPAAGAPARAREPIAETEIQP